MATAGIPWEWEKARVDEVLKEFALPRETLEELIERMTANFNSGLSGDSNERLKSPIKMLPTYVRSTPDGTEEGHFFALDLGGTNFRVLFVGFHNKEVSMSQQVFPISEALMIGTAEDLFGYIAECLTKFAKEKLGEDLKKISSVGFTFSFPVDQKSLVSGTLISWTKGFNVSGVEGVDIVALLYAALEKRNEIEVDKIALLNDTTGVMISCAFDDPNVAMGIILGTGTNACYMEQLCSVGKWDGDDKEPKQVVINTEWGAFGDLGELKNITTSYDVIIDDQSIRPRQQAFEKMISGMYLGEIVRQCLLGLIKKFVILRGCVSSQLAVRHSFLTMYVSDFCSGEAKRIIEILSLLGYENATIQECQVVRDICIAVSRRAARLAAVGVATIIRRMNKQSLTVAVDGSLIKKHPTFKRFMYQALDELLPSTRIKIRLAEDGSGRGAALVAAVAERLG